MEEGLMVMMIKGGRVRRNFLFREGEGAGSWDNLIRVGLVGCHCALQACTMGERCLFCLLVCLLVYSFLPTYSGSRWCLPVRFLQGRCRP